MRHPPPRPCLLSLLLPEDTTLPVHRLLRALDSCPISSPIQTAFSPLEPCSAPGWLLLGPGNLPSSQRNLGTPRFTNSCPKPGQELGWYPRELSSLVRRSVADMRGCSLSPFPSTFFLAYFCYKEWKASHLSYFLL